MRHSSYDVFISYRRAGGSELAQLVCSALAKRGFRVFMDVRELSAGKFDAALKESIENTENFIVILTPGCLERCAEETDWFRQEITLALISKRKIVPLKTADFEFPPAKTLPKAAALLTRHHCVTYVHEHSEASLDKLCGLLRRPRHIVQRRWLIGGIAAVASLLLAFLLWQFVQRISATHAPTDQKPPPAPPLAIAPFNTAQAHVHQAAWAQHLAVPVEFTNSIGMKFCFIPPGEYERGTPPERVNGLIARAGVRPGEIEGIRSESPRHRVRLSKPFYLAACEVTQGQFARVMDRNPSHFGPQSTASAPTPRPLLPVENITFDDAVSFCKKLTELDQLPPRPEGSGYRLPTDAQWEYACRAGTTGPYWFELNRDIARYAIVEGHDSPALVGTLEANPFGLFDMHGNVWEMCQDFFDVADFAQFGPGIIESPTGPATGQFHVNRGGAFNAPALQARTASRRPGDGPRSNLGFRPVLAVESVRATLARRQMTQKPSDPDRPAANSQR